MTLQKRIANNIRALREYYGETEEQLGEVIGYAISTISSFETGTRRLNLDALGEIAKHYGVSEAAILSWDFQNLESAEQDADETIRNLEVDFPIIATKKALENKRFTKAYTLHHQLYKRLQSKSTKCFDDTLMKKFESCLLCYFDLVNETGFTTEVKANLLGLRILYLMMIMKRLLNLSNQRKTLVHWMPKIRDARDVFGKAYEEDEAISWLIEKLDYPKSIEDIVGFTRDVIKSPKYHELGEYYLALQYGYDIIDNENETMVNYQIGYEMLEALAMVGNKYAVRVME